MATAETQVSVNTNLQKQDLSNLEISNLTPLSPEVISRQATINIGTIGHVAHGKSTVVKAISGVQTVRFKNELERNITIKLERLSEKKIQKLLLSKQQREIYELKQRERLMDLKFKTKTRRSMRLMEQVELDRSRDRRSRSQSSTSPCSSGYGSVLGSDDQQEQHQVSKSLKRRRSQIESSSTPPPSAKRAKDNVGLVVPKQKPPKGEYVVEYIESVEVKRYEPVFYVKWLGYDKSSNTWETLENLTNCKALDEFVESKLKFYEKYVTQVLEELEEQLKTLENKENFTIRQIDGFEPMKLQLDLILLAQYRASGSRSLVERARITERALSLMRLKNSHSQRCQQLIELAKFEERINKVEEPSPPIRVENHVDLDTIDSGFNYIKNNILCASIPNPEGGLLGCKCHDDGSDEAAECTPSSRCCGRLAGERFAYDRATKRLRLQPGHAIYECNSRCSCDSSCSNRLIQHGRKHELVLFKTSNGSGWGVRTPHALRKGEFICEYIGEIITSDEANERGKIYDDRGRTYLFDLDYNVAQESEYTIDAANYGNISHFINHSCDPNLAVFPCWIEHLNVALPRLVFFTLRPIKAGEELSFDYIRADNEEIPYENLSKAARVECRCGADNCRKVLF
ncbi:uncharacterized protein Dwil_GK12089, isoform B [Drosophila willistoni]|uniref:Histone-lysine N-methyltransferase n=1 Tax=Drosophila willistoni TaxID=7260 RepID=B4N8L8_DROWI|nr:histone-lysine N-methyltransferase Su(var)3-9 isoform X1 [Drosophila willistoni]EDW81469.2 uncharacterized protein Dwil_GK12089, isoform B [Drosophila willistoni]